MSTNSAEVTKQGYIDKMGVEFGKVFHSLRNELIWLSIKWMEFQILYTKESRVALLNKAAPVFSHMLQNILLENIILSMAKITDQEKSGKYKSITTLLLPGYIDNVDLKHRIDLTVKKLSSLSKSFKDLRDKKIAHKDFSWQLNDTGTNFFWPSLESIREFLTLCYEMMNEIELYYMQATTMYNIDHMTGSLHLLYAVENGLRFDNLRLEMAKQGDRSLNDFESVI
ncbi:MAG: hypothetical protein IPI77_18385 [Saprospiraceae bacterium]|nr:hypothetical protein [Saprospiraceae bacterium]